MSLYLICLSFVSVEIGISVTPVVRSVFFGRVIDGRNSLRLKRLRLREYEEAAWHLTQTQRPDWKVGEGANNEEWKQHKTVELDPNDPKRVSLLSR